MPTSWKDRREGFVLVRDHDHSLDNEYAYHEWVGLNRPDDRSYLDWLGRKTESAGGRWDHVICNNTNCHALAMVRRGLIERLVRDRFPLYPKETP